jgi:hypothetical protein
MKISGILMLAVLLLFGIASLHAQPCGTNATAEDVSLLERYNGDAISYDRSWTRGIKDIPIKFHIVRTDSGDEGIDESLLESEVERLNEIFGEANMRFLTYDQPNYIDDSRFTSYYTYMEESLCASTEVEKVVNVYCLPEMSGLCGYTYFPRGSSLSNRIFMNNGCMGNGSTFVHEVGHFFGLWHTHGTSNTGTTDEYVSRLKDRDGNGIPDCEETGDRCCDTPADPNLGTYSAYCSSSCGSDYDCQAEDPDGNCYEPMTENLMSYNPNKRCRNMITPQQLSRVEVVATNERAYLQVPENIASPVGSCGEEVSGLVEFKLKEGRSMPVSLDENLYRFDNPYRTGTEFTFSAENDSEVDLNLYIINMDARGKIQKVFPYYNSENPELGAGDTYHLGFDIVLANDTGREYACFLFVRGEMDIDKIVQRLSYEEGSFTQRLYEVLGDNILLRDKVTYREGNRVNFSGCLEEGEILPVMLEMNHI